MRSSLLVAVAVVFCNATTFCIATTFDPEQPKPAKPGKPAAIKQPAEKKPLTEKGEMKPQAGKPSTPKKPGRLPAAVGDTTPRRDPTSLAARIDRLIEARFAQEKIPASPTADDAEFMRRPALDIVGRIPTYEEAKAFLDSEN